MGNWIDTPQEKEAFAAFEKKSYDECIELFKKVIASRVKKGEDDLKVGLAHYFIGICYLEKQGFDEALENLQKAEEIGKKRPGTNAEAMSRVQYFIGLAYLRKKMFNEANDYFKKALMSKLTVGSKNDPMVADIYENIARVCVENDNWDEGLKNFKTAIEVRKEALGADDLKVSASYLNLGVLCAQKERFDDAIEFIKTAIDVRTKKTGPEDPVLGEFYTLLGKVTFQRGKTEEAISHLKKAVELKTKKKGSDPNPNSLAEVYLILGKAYQEKCYFEDQYTEEAIKYFNLALAIRSSQVSKNGQPHPDVSIILFNLAAIYEDKESYDEAINCIQKEVENKAKQFGPTHPITLAAAKKLKELYVKKVKKVLRKPAKILLAILIPLVLAYVLYLYQEKIFSALKIKS